MGRVIAPYLPAWNEDRGGEEERDLEAFPDLEAQITEDLLEQREAEGTPAWLKVVDDLSQGDRTRWDFFFSMSVQEGLNAQSFYVARKKEQQEMLNNPPAQSSEEFIARAVSQILFTR